MKAKRNFRTVLLGLFLFGSFLGMVEAGMADGSRTGMLTGSGGHNATGTVSVSTDNSGGSTLTLSDIRVDRLPDGRVYLARDGDYRQGVELGMLKQFTGTVSFPIPSGTDPGEYNSVVIWCERFSVEIGRAFLTKKQP